MRLDRDAFGRIARDKGAATVVQQAKLTGVPRRTLYNLFSGVEPSLSTVVKITDSLGVPISAVFQRDES